MTAHTGRGLEARRVLLVGPGVSDGRRRTWAYLTRPLMNLGHRVYLSDTDAAKSPEILASTFEWNVRTNRPHLVVHVADGVDAHDAGISRLTASGEATTVLVNHPFALDPIGVGGTPRSTAAAHHLELAIGDDRPLMTDPTCFLAPDRAPSVDVIAFGPRSRAGEEVAAELAGRGVSFRLLDPSWDGHPLLRGLAYGRPPVRFLTRRLGRGRVVLVLPSAHRAETELRLLEASCAGRPVVDLEAPGVARDVPGALAAALGAAPTPAPTTGWSDAWPGLVDEAMAVHDPEPPARSFWSFNTVPPSRPKVAVLTSVYRGADYLIDAVDSLLDQTMSDIEVMLLDDGSDDETTEMIEMLSKEDRRVRGFRQENIGQAGRFDLLAHQIAVESNATAFAHLGADDVAHPERFARQLEVLAERPEIHVVSSIGVKIDGGGRSHGLMFNQPEMINSWSMQRFQLVMNTVAHPTVMMRAEVFDLVGPYSRGFAADYDFWTKAAAWLGFHRIDEPLVAYRVHERGSSSVGRAAKRAAHEFEWIRDTTRRELTLLDLYPELERLGLTPEHIARAAAHFATLLLTAPYEGSALHALRESEMAQRYVEDPLIDFNALLAAIVSRREPKDMDQQLRRMARDGLLEAQIVLDRMAGKLQSKVQPIKGPRVFPELDRLVPGPEDDVWFMHTRGRSTKVAWVELDWRDDATLRTLLHRWCEWFPAPTPARLVLDQRGIDVNDAVLALQKAIADRGLAVEQAADIEVSVDTELRKRADVHIDLTTAAGRDRLDRGLLRLQRRLLFV